MMGTRKQTSSRVSTVEAKIAAAHARLLQDALLFGRASLVADVIDGRVVLTNRTLFSTAKKTTGQAKKRRRK